MRRHRQAILIAALLLALANAGTDRAGAVGVERTHQRVAAITALSSTEATDTYTKWKKRKSGTTQPLVGVDFVSPTWGWVVGYGGTILRTTDGGVTWRKQKSGVTCELNAVDFVGGRTGWVVGYDRPANRAVILKTMNGGATWFPQSHPTPTGTWPTAILAVDAARAWGFCGGIAPNKSIFATSDGGATWAGFAGAPVGVNLFGVSRPRGSAGAWSAWTFGYPNLIARTEDAGGNWRVVPHSIAMQRPNAAAFSSTQQGIIAGDLMADTTSAGIVMRTADGGSNWELASVPTTEQLRGAAAAGNHFWVVGERGTIYHSSDGGRVFRRQKSPAGSAALWEIQALSTKKLVAVGLNGTILTGSR